MSRFGQAVLSAASSFIETIKAENLITTSQQLDDVFISEGHGISAAGVNVTPKIAETLAAVYSCVRVVTTAIAPLDFSVQRKVGDKTYEMVEDHPVHRLFNVKPNEWQTPHELKEMLFRDVEYRGNAYCMIVRNSRRQVMELLRLHPDSIQPEQHPTKNGQGKLLHSISTAIIAVPTVKR